MQFVGEQFSSSALLKRLVREYVMRYRGRLFFAIGCMITGAAMTAANAYMMKPVIDKVLIAKDAHALMVVPLIVLAIALVNAAASYGQVLMMRYVGQRIISDMQVQLFSHLMRCDLALFHDQSSGRLISRFTNDINMMRHAVSNALTTLTRELLSMVFLVALMVVMSPKLAFIALCVFPIAIWPMYRLSKRMRKIADGTQEQLGEFTTRLDEVFQSARTVKAYNREAYEEQRARGMIEQLFGLYIKASRVQAAASPMMEALSGIAIAAVIAYGGAQVIQGFASAGALGSFITAFIMAYRPVKALAGVNTMIQEGLSAANRFFNAIDSQPRIQDKPGASALEVRRGQIEFRDVNFHYAPGAGGVDHITLAVQPGQKVALVGHSGGGKSTLFNLLLRLYEVESGAICIDGTDIHSVTQLSLRESIAFVPQETVLFDDTVKSNIAYGRLEAREEEIIAAARAAHADEFIVRLPQGYDTLIGPHGVRLSGGQRQRLAIARAMLKNAPILLLDEATSALDNTSERMVQEALSRLMQGRTTLLIAHRLSTVIGADLIHVIEHGRVVESGTHAALLAKGDAYHRLYAETLASSA